MTERTMIDGRWLDHYDTMVEFYAERGGQHSPEWDYGVQWVQDQGHTWPNWRVSWVVETGDVYAVCTGKPSVVVLGIVPRVGEYPYGTDTEIVMSRMEQWHDFKQAQTIERLMDGWADESHRSLSWVLTRLEGVTA
jgi:hypothetical protein